MNILIIGCGRLGSRLAKKLDRMGHDIAVVDRQVEAFENLDESFSGITFTGNPIDLEILRAAGIESCDAVAATTPEDNLNITVCQIARKIFHIENVVSTYFRPLPGRNLFHVGAALRLPHQPGLRCAGIRFDPAGQRKPNAHFRHPHLSFSMRPAERRMMGINLNMLHLPDEKVLGVLRKDGSVLLYSDPCHIVVEDGDQILYTRLAD